MATTSQKSAIQTPVVAYLNNLKPELAQVIGEQITQTLEIEIRKQTENGSRNVLNKMIQSYAQQPNTPSPTQNTKPTTEQSQQMNGTHGESVKPTEPSGKQPQTQSGAHGAMTQSGSQKKQGTAKVSSTPSPATIQAAKQRFSIPPPSTPSGNAEKLQADKNKQKYSGAESAEDQEEDDEQEQEEIDREQQMIDERVSTQTESGAAMLKARQMANTYTQDIEKKFSRQKESRVFANIADPAGRGMIQGGTTLISFFFSALVGLPILILGGITCLFSQFILLTNSSKIPAKPPSQKRIRAWRAIPERQARQWYVSTTSKKQREMSQKISSQFQIEMLQKALMSAFIQPLFVGISVLIGAILTLALIYAILKSATSLFDIIKL